MENLILGVDIGGTGIKGALIDLNTGTLASERLRIATPQPATPEAVAEVFRDLVTAQAYEGPVGVGFPAIVKNGIALTAANIDKEWIGKHVERLLSGVCGQPVFALNDADAAGIAEVAYGEGQGRKGLTIMVTVGSGIGSSLFWNGELLPNTEFGHVQFRGDIAERYASNWARKDQGLTWSEWGKRFNEYLQYLYFLLSADAFIISGGISKKFDKFAPCLDLPIPVVPAKLRNNAGTVGAALFARQKALGLKGDKSK